jgi:hypothetical protein
MKEYTINFKSFQTITGTISEETIECVISAFKKNKGSHKITFKDKDSSICVDLETIESIYYNDIAETNKTGF